MTILISPEWLHHQFDAIFPTCATGKMVYARKLTQMLAVSNRVSISLKLTACMLAATLVGHISQSSAHVDK